MKGQDVRELLELIELFLSGADCSLSNAGKIENAIYKIFPDDEYMEDVIIMLASYRPGGGDFLYDEEELKKKLRHVKARLQKIDDPRP